MTQALPVFNGADYLESAIASLVGQTYDDFELVIGDNASTDATEEICRAFAQKDARVRYLRSEVNRGIAWNWNRLVEAARGEYFRFAAHDDLVAPRYLEATVTALDAAAGDVVLCYPRTVDIDEDGRELGLHDDDLDLREPAAHDRLAHLLRRMRFCNPLFGVMRLDVLRSTGRMRPYAHADRVLLAEMCLRGKFLELAEPLFYRRVYPGRSMERYTDPRDVDRLYDPARRASAGVPYTRLFTANFGAVWSAPLGTGERARCAAVAATAWPFYRKNARELRSLVTRARRRGGRDASSP